MSRNPQQVSTAGTFTLAAVLLNAIVLRSALTLHPGWYAALLLTVPLVALSWVRLSRHNKNRSNRSPI